MSWIGLLGLIVPFAVGYGTGWLLYPYIDTSLTQAVYSLFLGAALSISALPVIARVLLDLDMLKTSLGNLIVAVATLNDVIGWILFTVVLSLSGASGQHNSIILTILFTVILALLAISWLRTGMSWLLAFVHRTLGSHGAIMAVTIVAMLIASLITEHIGIHAVFGAFLMGIAVNGSRHFTHENREHIHQFTTHLLAPLFFAAVGLRINFLQSFNWRIVVVILVAAYVSKLVAALLGGRLAQLSTRHSLAVGLGIAARGGMCIILAILALDANLIGPVMFEALVIMALVTSMTSGLIKGLIAPPTVVASKETTHSEAVIAPVVG